MRREPEDDYLHEPEDASNFNESRYYNFYDKALNFGGWVRMGNRPNEGYAEMTVCLYQPDGSVAFMYKRPKIEGHTEHNAGGLKFEVIKPYEEHQISYNGKLCILANPKEMAEPKEAFLNNPYAECELNLHLKNIGPGWGGEPVWDDDEEKPDLDPEKMFARGHTEQHMTATGTVKIGDTTYEVKDANGLRDHSWGPRFWQNVWWYRWLTVNLGEDLGFCVTIAGKEEDPDFVGAHGFLYDKKRYGDDRWVSIKNAELKSDYDDEWYPKSNSVVITTEDHVYNVKGDVWSNIPLRNRREGMVTRITEGMTKWSYEDLSGGGLSEYLDQIIENIPVGTQVGI
jgi:hypothetical protein